jgi:formiminoglutamase
MHLQPDMNQWQGRVDTMDGELGRRWHQIVSPDMDTASGHGIALVGFACDAGVARNHGRIGAARGPAVLRSALGNMPVHECRSIVDTGDVVCQPEGDAHSNVGNVGNEGLEAAQEELALQIDAILGTGRLPIAMGGGHEIAYGSFSGLARHLEKQEEKPRIGILNLDAHFDLRMAERASSGTPFRQIAEECGRRGWPFHYGCFGVSRFANTEALFARARELNAQWRLDEHMSIQHLEATLEAVNHFLAGADHVYLTTCLDVLPGSVAPGVSASAACGVSLQVVEAIIDAVIASGKLRLADLAELNPEHDIDQRTARVAARLLARIANGHCASTRT